MTRILVSASGKTRLAVAAEFVRSFPPSTELVVVAATREAADDFARELTAEGGATFGIHRFSPAQLVARLAADELARQGLAPLSSLGAEAVAARAAFEAASEEALPAFAPVSRFPGFARAAAATLTELRSLELGPSAVRGAGAGDAAELLERFGARLSDAGVADRAERLRIAAEVVRRGKDPLARAPSVWLDVAVHDALEASLLGAYAAAGPQCLVTVPDGDDETLAAVADLGEIETVAPDRSAPPALARLQRTLFRPPGSAAEPATEEGGVTIFSAPGEGRECQELARGILDLAREGLPFDRIAVVVRSPEIYDSLLETAFGRAGIPVWFARGTRRPDPSGRALLALLACRAEGLSARRFAEYLSFAQVPDLVDGAPPPVEVPPFALPEDEALGVDRPGGRPAPSGEGQLAFDFGVTEPAAPDVPDEDDLPVVGGSLRAPWRWEELLVEAAIVGGADRWARRIRGLECELRLKLAQLRSDEPGSSRGGAIERELVQLGHLGRFALPVIEELAAFPEKARWGAWLRRIGRLLPRVLRRPDRCLALLADLEPMAAVGPVDLEEVRVVLAPRLTTIEAERPDTRYGRVFVGTPDQVRGRSFDAVMVPGLAERLFPRRPREDPLLLDDRRREIGDRLVTQEQRGLRERLQLRLAVGAAERRLFLTYPRIEVAQARPRVPSFYALDVVRATSGRLPDSEQLERDAAARANARLVWPAPQDAQRAIDPIEHDLAVLGPLLAGEGKDVQGRARYLLELSAPLGRSLRARWARWRRAWSAFDGIVRKTDETGEALDAHRLTERAYSVTALQQFAACPYRFLLGAIYRLEPRKESAPIETLDPRTRGQIFHHVQADTLRALQDQRLLPLDPERLGRALAELDGTLDRLAQRYREDLVPAIGRVWDDEIDAMRADLRTWLRMTAEPSRWAPKHFEFAFGLPTAPAFDPASTADPVTLDGGYRLRGVIDLVEEADDGTLRVTDHKTGVDRTHDGFVVGGGQTLQPALYGLALETLSGRPVGAGRLFFCTARGGFRERTVELHPLAREWTKMLLETIDRSVETGFLAPAPARDACKWCDFRPVCGRQEELRTSRKNREPLDPLAELRKLP